ncbi:MAG TPA: enolase C-terminal domain-like protein [Bdellovibrionales bacterium]|nr:enolase C-terminal domain-like protein [Bdellovibrionales bacterium]
MKTDFWFSFYTLISKAGLGSKAETRERRGALMRVDTSEGSGFADLHPWTELGDLPLEKQIESLVSGAPATLAKRSLELAAHDRAARAAKKSLFSDLQIPKSHFLVTDLSAFDSNALDAAAGFTTFKFKLTKAFATELQTLESVASRLQGFRLRFDMNAAFDARSADSVLVQLKQLFGSAIEFVEDPCPYDKATWAKLSQTVPLAYDRPGGGTSDVESEFVIFKPAVQDSASMVAWTKNSRVIVTSYLDHPIGQMGAAFEAARFYKGCAPEVCGLLSQHAYLPNEFSGRMEVSEARLIPSLEEAGIGFADLLEKQNWRRH